MADLPISACFWDYDRTRPLLDGRVAILGVKPAYTVLNPVDAFAKAFSTAEYDVTELSLSHHISTVAKGTASYNAIPVHLSRTFRHSIVFVRADRGIASPADLKGKTIGTPDYDMTASVVIRGLLRDEYGLKPSDMAWRIADLEKPDRPQPQHQRTVPGVDIQPLTGRTLDGELARGGLDAVISVHVPPCFAARNPAVKRLFPDWRSAEQDYVARTGIFPIMHVVGIRKDVLAKRPEIARALYDAFEAAKQIAINDLGVTQAPKVTLPWVTAELAATRAALGDDYWPYGIRKNQHVLDMMLRYAHEEGLTTRLHTVKDLFVPECLEL